jgi:hypothetical protein
LVLLGECSAEAMQQALVLLRAARTPAIVKFRLIKLFVEQEFGAAPHSVWQQVHDNRQPAPAATFNLNLAAQSATLVTDRGSMIRDAIRRPPATAQQREALEQAIVDQAEEALRELPSSPPPKATNVVPLRAEQESL